jgi:arginyl-tRNA synthetase
MLTLLSELGRLAADALRARFAGAEGIPAEVAVGPAQRPDLGDLQISAALQLAKALKQKPRDIADAMVAGLAHPAVLSTSIDGPGFINLKLREEYLAELAETTRKSANLGLRPIGAGQRVVLDYSSPNAAKPMHIGHIRSTIIGDAIKRVLRAVGYEVIADNHLGDWGTQFGKLIVAYRRWLDEKAFAADPIAELLRLYVKFTEEEERETGHKAADSDDPTAAEGEADIAREAPPILNAARAELVKLQRGDAENVALWKTIISASMAELDKTYRRLGVTFDVVLGESFYDDRLEATVDRLMKEGIASESQGALVVFFDKARDGEDMPPLIVRKRDGGFNYATTDVAGVLYRMERWSPQRIIIVVDERQQLYFRQFFAVARRLGITASLEHVWFGLMRMPEGTISTRKGKLIHLSDLLDEAERRAADVAKEHSPELSDDERKEIARVVGIGAVKYNDLSKDRQTLVTFTWDKALSLQGNTAAYLQYAYARIRSILRKAEAESQSRPSTIGRGGLEPTERALITRLLWFGNAVEQVARTTKPHVLSDYLFELATAFSTFYAAESVLKAEPEVRAARLALCDLTAQTLRVGLGLLGIEVLDRM